MYRFCTAERSIRAISAVSYRITSPVHHHAIILIFPNFVAKLTRICVVVRWAGVVRVLPEEPSNPQDLRVAYVVPTKTCAASVLLGSSPHISAQEARKQAGRGVQRRPAPRGP